MSTDVMDFLVKSGGGALHELFARVSSRPQTIVKSLRVYSDKGLVRLKGPRTLKDLEKLITDLRGKNGYDSETIEEQRQAVAAEIVEHQRGFMSTFVHPTAKAITLSLR